MQPFANSITQLFKIKYPIIQAGMVWASGWRLASAVSNAGGLGLIGSGSMYPEVLRQHIIKCRAATSHPFGVNVPLLYPDIEKHIDIIISEKVPIVFTSAGNPKTFTQLLKQNGITVVHVVSSSKFAIKAQEAGCDAVVAEGFEAGGHNGREEMAHAHRVSKAIRAISGEDFPPPDAADNPYLVGPIPSTPVTAAGLKKTAEAEFGGDALYARWAAATENVEAAALFRQNGKEETDHGNRLLEAAALLEQWSND